MEATSTSGDRFSRRSNRGRGGSPSNHNDGAARAPTFEVEAPSADVDQAGEVPPSRPTGVTLRGGWRRQGRALGSDPSGGGE
jgi:hypothetical protein